MGFYTAKDEQRVLELQNKNPFRTEWRRDFSRLIHSPSFRRLQGKTQLYPGKESDFFRNRLTHSLEVAQIAKAIASRLNFEYKLEEKIGQNIIEDITEFAGIAHDLGHPPFGHIGEKALNELMFDKGGFEGNAQTLRILGKTEKKEEIDETNYGITKSGSDKRVGLNLTMRSLGAILKYDNCIPLTGIKTKGNIKVIKGYYLEEAELVKKIKKAVLTKPTKDKFKTIECKIMDLADDIAYSTYDLEDAFKANFIKPLDLLFAEESILLKVLTEINKSEDIKIDISELKNIIFDLIGFIMKFEIDTGSKNIPDENIDAYNYLVADVTVRTSNRLAKIGYKRVQFTSELVDKFINGIEFKYNKVNPVLSDVKFNIETLKKVETLKKFTYQLQIMSPRLKIVEYRGMEITKRIFTSLNTENGYQLMPEDYQEIYEAVRTDQEKMRTICDFVAGMTDSYAIEFYGRLTSENPETIFKPY